MSWPNKPAPTPPSAQPLPLLLSMPNNSPARRNHAVSKPLPMLSTDKPSAPRRLKPILLLPLLLLTGCATVREPLPPVVVQCPAIPELPASARQANLPTLSADWQALVESLLPEGTAPSSPAKPANKPTTR